MRELVSGSPTSASVWRLICSTVSSMLRRTSRSTPAGSARYRTGFAPDLRPTPPYFEERNPLLHRQEETGWLFSLGLVLLCRTMKVGRLSFMLPSPYASHAPKHGLPAFMLPVFMSIIAGS